MIKDQMNKLWTKATLRRLKIISELIDPHPNEVLLVPGCYDGRIAMEFVRYARTPKVWGIDWDEGVLEIAKNRGLITFQSDLNQPFPIDTSSVDLVISDQVIEHLFDLDNFCGEIRRVLKSGGECIVSTENLASWHNIFALILGDQPFSGPNPSKYYKIAPFDYSIEISAKKAVEKKISEHIKVLSFVGLRKLFEAYGFMTLKHIGVGYVPLPDKLASIMSRIDPRHSLFTVLKVRKP